jgi:predicted transcriptional regulator
MEKNASNTLKHIFNDNDLSQKEIGSILGKTQAGISKNISELNFTVKEIVQISEAKGRDFFEELSVLLPITIRNKNDKGEYKSLVEEAILNLVKKKLK